MSRFCAVILLGILLSVSGCATVYNPATEQNELIFVTTPVEVSIGNALAAKISKQFKISSDKKKTDRLNEIGKKIAAVSDRKDLVYRFGVIEDDALNAFTAPGGYVYVNSGVIERSTDDELACVVGHEVGHIAARHIAKKMQAQIGYDILMNIAARKGGLGDLQRATSISFDLIMLGYSRQDESLADRLGVKYAYKAGYDPYAMISFLEKLKEANKEEMGFVFLRSHPYISDRIKMLKMATPGIIDKVDKKSSNATTIVMNVTKIDANKADKERPLKVMCPKCRRIFSGKRNYCPYDGTKLQ